MKKEQIVTCGDHLVRPFFEETLYRHQIPFTSDGGSGVYILKTSKKEANYWMGWIAGFIYSMDTYRKTGKVSA